MCGLIDSQMLMICVYDALQAAKMLAVLSQEEAGAEYIFRIGNISKIS
jgi:hypothetical protein